MAESWSLSISGKNQHVGDFFFLPFSLFSKAPRHEIHTFQSAPHREAGILTLIQRDEPEKLSTDPTLLSNKSTNLKKTESERDRTKEQKNITFLSRLDLGLHTWFPDTEEAQQHQTEV